VSQDATAHNLDQSLERSVAGRRQLVEHERSAVRLDEFAVHHEYVGMHVKVSRRSEALNECDRAGLPAVQPACSGAACVKSEHGAHEQSEHGQHALMVVRKPIAKRVRQAQHPLAHWRSRNDVIYNVGLGSLFLPRLRGEAIDNFFAKLAAKELSPKSRKNVRATLRRILASAVEWGYHDALPFLPKIKVPEAPWDFFTKEESALLLAAARSPDARLLLMFALHTGARAGEQLALLPNVNFRSNLVVFRRSSTRGVVGHTKRRRDQSPAYRVTRSRAEGVQAHAEQAGVLQRRRLPRSLWQLHERLEMVCRRAGLRRIRWHDVRHSLASQLATAGVPIRQIQAWLNHSTIHMSMRYAHLAPDVGAELISALEQPIERTERRGNGVATS